MSFPIWFMTLKITVARYIEVQIQYLKKELTEA